MPHRESRPMGERGKTSYNIKCAICDCPVTISGYVLRDFEGYPLNRAGQRFDYTFPDGSVKQGPLCNACNDKVKNKDPMIYDEVEGKWKWVQ